MNQTAKKSKSNKVLNVVFIILMVIFTLIGASLINAKVKGESPNIFGIYFYRVETDSMYPVLPRKTIIVSKRVNDINRLKAGVDGDIVTFYNKNNERITHRIVDKVFDENNNLIGFRTKGDNPANSIDNEMLKFEKIEAVYIFKIF